MAELAHAMTESPKDTTHLVSFQEEKNGILTFIIDNVNVSIINAIRRTILADIPTLVFNCFPHDKNNADIKINTSRLNNEILKQRLSSIPIHIKDHALPYADLVVEVNMKNETENTIDVTTQHFKIKNITTDKYLQDSAVQKIFPPCSLTGDYILFARLRPKISTIASGEELSISATMDLHTAEEDGMFNVASTCAYKFNPDKMLQDEAWQNKLAEIHQEDKDRPEVIALLKQNWYNHEGLRYFKDNSFEFKLESIGVFSNNELLVKACEVIVNKLQNIFNDANAQTLNVEKSISTIPNSVDITLNETGYTIGKIIEFMINKIYYADNHERICSYVGFRKNHPHDSHSIIRIGYIDKSLDTTLEITTHFLIKRVCEDAIKLFNDIKENF